MPAPLRDQDAERAEARQLVRDLLSETLQAREARERAEDAEREARAVVARVLTVEEAWAKQEAADLEERRLERALIEQTRAADKAQRADLLNRLSNAAQHPAMIGAFSSLVSLLLAYLAYRLGLPAGAAALGGS